MSCLQVWVKPDYITSPAWLKQPYCKIRSGLLLTWLSVSVPGMEIAQDSHTLGPLSLSWSH